MKKLILIICVYLPIISFAQQGGFTIKGKIANLNSPAKLFLVYDDTIRDEAVLHDGGFEFDGTISHVYSAYLTLNKKGGDFTADNYVEFFIEPGNIFVNGPDSLAKTHITGTKNNDDNERYKALMAPIERRDEELEVRDTSASEQQKKSPQFLKELELLNKHLEEERKAANKKFITENPSSLVSLSALYSFAMYSDYSAVASLYDNLSPTVKNSAGGKSYALTLEKMHNVSIGNLAPDFELPDTDGNKVKLSSFRGKYLLLDFWPPGARFAVNRALVCLRFTIFIGIKILMYLAYRLIRRVINKSG